MKVALVLGAGGFIGHHMVTRLKKEGWWVRAVDLKLPQFENSLADEFLLMDLRSPENVNEIFSNLPAAATHVYQFAADMGGAGYIFTGTNDAAVMYNSALINLHLVNNLEKLKKFDGLTPTVFYSSSACVYPEHIQIDPQNLDLREESAYPANPDSEYGWEKLFSERLYQAFSRNLAIDVRIARFHNIYGPMGTWQGGKEKAPAAICRKVLEAGSDGEIEIWGDGNQTRSFLYIDDCIEAVWRFMNQTKFMGPMNIGSDEMVTINDLVKIASEAAGYVTKVRHVDGPLGVRGRNSNNKLLEETLGWNYQVSLRDGIGKTIKWIESQMKG